MDTDSRIVCRVLREDARGFVGGAVVEHDELQVLEAFGEDALNRVAQKALAVIDGHHDRDGWAHRTLSLARVGAGRLRESWDGAASPRFVHQLSRPGSRATAKPQSRTRTGVPWLTDKRRQRRRASSLPPLTAACASASCAR